MSAPVLAAMPAVMNTRKALIKTATSQTRAPCSPSRNSASWPGSCQRERMRPATYPPSMMDPICCAIAQNTASEAITLADSPEFGHGEGADSPIAAPKVSSTKEIAAASTAPASTAPHSTKLKPAVSVRDATGALTCTMISLLNRLVQPKDAQDEHHHDDQTHKVNDAVHDAATSAKQSNLGLCAFELSGR